MVGDLADERQRTTANVSERQRASVHCRSLLFIDVHCRSLYLAPSVPAVIAVPIPIARTTAITLSR